MPRPRQLKHAKVVPVILEAEQYEALRELASRSGLSVSAFIRQLIDRELARLGQAAEGGPQPQPQADPLLQLEVEEFKERLEKLSRSVEALERRLAAAGHYYGGAGASALRSQAWRLLDEWSSLCRFYKSSIPRSHELSAALVEVKRRINAILRATGQQQGQG